MNQNKRITKQRIAILEVFKDPCTILTAQEVYHCVSNLLPKISLGTIYRNLDTLTKNHVLTKIIFPDGTARYQVADHDHHHQLVCLKCGNTVNLPGCPIDNTITDFVSKERFEPAFHKFDIYGYCHLCRKK